MIELANKIAEMVQSGNILWLAVITVIAFAMKLSKVLEFLKAERKLRL